MNLQNLLNQFTGANANPNTTAGLGGGLDQLAQKIPGGLAGGAAAGGIMALLLSSKSARKFAGKAATVGGTALLGGLAYSAFKNWQANSQQSATDTSSVVPNEQQLQNPSADFQLTLVKAMIAAAKADGHIDSEEQQRIFDAVDKMDLDNEVKGVVFDLLRQPISLTELTQGLQSLEQKTEVYLAACLAINPEHPSEKAYLEQLAQALALPAGLPEHIQLQAQQAFEQ